MTLKRYLLVLMAALAVFACKPAPDPDDYIVDPQEQNDPQDDGTDDNGDENGNTSDDNGGGGDDNGGDNGGDGNGGTGDDNGSGEGGEGGGENGGDDNGGDDNGGEGGEQQASQPGWFELPVVNSTCDSDGYLIDAANPNIYYAYHKSDIGTRNYTVCYNGAYLCPVWVAGPRHQVYSANNVSRTKSYSFDPDIPLSAQPASTSGSTSGYNRGHMIGSDERTGSSLTNKQMMYITNIAPQGDPWFNSASGGWNPLEAVIDGFECSDTLYVVVGAYFEDYTDAYGNSAVKKTATFLKSTVQIPTMFYYACLRTKKGNSGKSLKDCNRDEIMCAAFVRAHSQGTAGQAVTAKEMMTIDKLEEITGFDYFQAVPNAPEDTFTASDWGL